jgi:hypothetical protein
VASAAMRTFPGGKWEADFSPDSRLLVAANNTGGGLFDARSGKRLGTLSTGATGVKVPADGTALIMNGPSPARFAILSGSSSDTLRLGPPEPLVTTQGDRILTWTKGGAEFLDREPLKEALAERPGAAIVEASTTHGGEWGAAVVVARDSLPSSKIPWGSDSVIVVWNRQTRGPPRWFPAPESTHLFFSSDGQWLAARSEHGLRVWRAGTWELHALRDEGGFSAIIFSADGRVMPAAVSSTQVRLRETSTWKELVTLEWPMPYPPSSGALSPDGGRLALTSDGIIRLWDLRAVRDGLVMMGLDWGTDFGPTVGDNDTAGWGPPRLLHLERNVTSAAQ